jgi:hypothetical protein
VTVVTADVDTVKVWRIMSCTASSPELSWSVIDGRLWRSWGESEWHFMGNDVRIDQQQKEVLDGNGRLVQSFRSKAYTAVARVIEGLSVTLRAPTKVLLQSRPEQLHSDKMLLKLKGNEILH